MLGACATPEATIARTEQLRDQAAQARDQARTRLDELESARGQIPPGSTEDERAESAVLLARARLAALESAVDHADRVLAEIRSPTDGLTQGVGTLAPLLPAPIQGPLLLGSALAVTLLRARQVRVGADSIARSIQKAMGDPVFRDAFERHADAIRSIQTPAARRIVDQATGRTRSISPI